VQGTQTLQRLPFKVVGFYPSWHLGSLTFLRYSSVSITLDVYSYVIPGLGDAAALAMEETLVQSDGAISAHSEEARQHQIVARDLTEPHADGAEV